MSASGKPAPSVLGSHAAPVTALAFGFKAGIFASAGKAGAVKVWDSSLGVPLIAMSAPERKILALAYAPDGETIV